MRAKKINEDLTPFRPKSEEELNSLIKVGGPVTADILAKLINDTEIGENIKVNFTGAWDRFGPIQKAWVKDINQGAGFESALFVNSRAGTFIYLPEFQLDNLPSDDVLLIFYAGKNSIYVDYVLS